MHIKKPALTQWLAWFLAALSLALVVAGLVVSWRHGQRWLGTHLVFAQVTTITYALIGALVAARQPRNPIGWIFGAVGVFAGLTWLSSSYKMVGQSMLPGFEVAQWLNLWIWIPTSILPLTFVLLLFPAGRLPSARWRPIAWSAGLGLAAYILSTALHPRPPIEPDPPLNPFGIPGAAGALDLLGNIAGILLAVGGFGSLTALVVRFRRSRGIESEQIKWLA